MLHICRSNRVESLLQRLAERLAAQPLSSPLLPEMVVTPSPAMARWVNLQLAARHGVAANYHYPLPASFIWQLARELLGDLPETDPLAPEVMTWKVYALLPELVREPAFTAIAHYLRQDADGLKRLQLAGRIADVFDRYQFYRPRLLRDWGDGQDGQWQAELWRRLTRGIAQHRLAVITRLLSRLLQKGGQTPFPEILEKVSDPLFGSVPERVSLFAVSSLPPLFVEVLHALASHTQVDLYLHSPTDQFWADLVSQKTLARKRLAQPEAAELWETGNSLLASWGRQGQALQDLLLMQETPATEEDVFIPPGTATLLQRVQHDIFTLRPMANRGKRIPVEADASLQVHVCHSPQRECQVLHDRLLAMLDDDPALRPEDMLVMVPEISLYAPYIEAVFEQDADSSRPFIPWNLSDISLRDEHPLVRVFLQLLDLPHSRFSHTEILSCLDVPELAGRFALDGVAVAQIREWLEQARLRWGLSAAHKRQFDLPATGENTWAQVEQRLFGGYALDEGELFEGIAPIGGVDGARGEILGRFWRLLSCLTGYAGRLRRPRRAVEWQDCLGRLLEDFFGPQDDEEGRLQKIRDALADLARQAAGVEETLPVALVRHWLERQLGTHTRHGRYFSGGVTFCGMRPMRSLPFRVICVLGLHDRAFPRREQPAEFDRMSEQWHPGDPRKGAEDRYLFLETLLCARQVFYLSYVGRDIRDNGERQPSVLLRELLDYVDQQYRVAGVDADDRLSARLTRVHPLQPFSPRNFRGDSRSYDGDWCAVAEAMRLPARPAAAGADWNRNRLSEPADPLHTVSLTQLLRFARHPVRFFVNTRLQVYLYEEAPGEDDEVFRLDALQSFGLKQRLLDEYLKGQPTPVQRLSAEGLLPHGAFAALAWEQTTQEVQSLTQRLADYRSRRPEQRLIDLPFEDESAGAFRLVGQIRGIYPGLGLLRYRPGRLKGPEILALWLEHLAWCAADGNGDKCSTLHGATEQFRIARTVDPAEAQAHLARYLRWYREGLQRPLPLLPGASYAWMRAVSQGSRGDPYNAAFSAWKGNDFNGIPGDKNDAYVQLVMRGIAGKPIDQAEFTELAQAFYADALAAGALT
jgi:exodeoxyribonuclease V gamma subunit